jgi:nicotinamide-nucleotide amidase
MTHGSGTIAAMPGVPYEMYGLAESVFARLADEEVAPPSCHSYFAGLGESSLQELLGDLSHDADDCRVGVYCHDGGHLEVVTVGSGATARDALVRERCAQYVLPANGLAASLVEVAQAAGVTIAVAESCTGGRIARALTAVPGASAVLTEALVTYTAAAKSSRLGVPPEVIAAHDVVSEAVVTAMALGVQPGQPSQPNQSNTATSYQDCLSIATTGYAGPTGGTERDPVGTVYVAVNFRGETQHVRLQTGGERQRIVQRASAKALLLAWQSLTAAVKV